MNTYFYIFLSICFTNYLNAQVSDFDSIDFTKADRMAALNKDASLDNLPLLAYRLTHTLPTQVEKFRAIYIWVCQNIKGDNVQFTKVIKKRKNDSISFMQWNQEYKKIVFKKLLKHKKNVRQQNNN